MAELDKSLHYTWIEEARNAEVAIEPLSVAKSHYLTFH